MMQVSIRANEHNKPMHSDEWGELPGCNGGGCAYSELRRGFKCPEVGRGSVERFVNIDALVDEPPTWKRTEERPRWERAVGLARTDRNRDIDALQIRSTGRR